MTARSQRRYLLLALIALFVNENLVQWALAITVGGLGLIAGFGSAFGSFSFFGYLFFTAFRLIPYVGLGLVLAVLSATRFASYVSSVFAGGLTGILGMILWGSWLSLRPLYTDEHVSSTTAIAFIFIPTFAVPAGALGAAVFAAVQAGLGRAAKNR